MVVMVSDKNCFIAPDCVCVCVCVCGRRVGEMKISAAEKEKEREKEKAERKALTELLLQGLHFRRTVH